MKTPTITDALYQYMLNHSTEFKLDSVLDNLRNETAQFGEDAVMQISALQGKWIHQTVKALGATNALEIGTFTGHSSICIASGLPANGRLTCLDVSEEWTRIAEKYWAQTGLDSKIDLILGPAVESLSRLGDRAPFDFVFIDAEKTEYDLYYERCLELTRVGGVIVFDNMLRGGKVLDFDDTDLGTKAIHELNGKLAKDPRVESVFLPIADGIQFCRKC